MNLAETRQFFGARGDDWAYFDNAGGSLVLDSVATRVADYLRTTPVQLGGAYPLSELAAARQAEATARLASFVNARPDEIVLGSSSTALTWQLARALRPSLREGDEIVITVMDHEANRSPWLWLRELGVRVKQWEIDRENFALSLRHLDELLGERTRLVAFSQCSNILGRNEPVAEITRRAHSVGARVLVDSVAYAPHRPIDVREWNVDFLVCSLYKLFGPHLGLMVGRREALLELGNINHEYLAADALPTKLQPGGASYELVWGAAGIVDYFDAWRETGSNPFAQIAEHEAELAARLLAFLDAHEKVSIIGPATADSAIRLPIIAFRHRELSSAKIVSRLQEHRVAAKHGHFHARRLLEFLGIPADDGVVRISFAHYNTIAEVERLLEALDAILDG